MPGQSGKRRDALLAPDPERLTGILQFTLISLMTDVVSARAGGQRPRAENEGEKRAAQAQRRKRATYQPRYGDPTPITSDWARMWAFT